MGRGKFEKRLLARASRLIGIGYSNRAVAQALDLQESQLVRLRQVIRGRLLKPADLVRYAQRCPGCGRKVLLPCMACAGDGRKRLELLLEA